MKITLSVLEVEEAVKNYLKTKGFTPTGRIAFDIAEDKGENEWGPYRSILFKGASADCKIEGR